MLRLRFSKTGSAVWISHLDTMRLFQRAFKRSGYHLTHTHGFNPRPSVSIALPLSVGVGSLCELLDFELEDPEVDCCNIVERLNANLIEGISVAEVYESGAKLKNLKYLKCKIDLDYDNGIPKGAANAIAQLFESTELWMDKKGKNGITTQNIIPMIKSLAVDILSENRICLNAVICCQEPSLNPAQLSAAVVKYLPQFSPNFTRCCRCEVLDADGQIFR